MSDEQGQRAGVDPGVPARSRRELLRTLGVGGLVVGSLAGAVGVLAPFVHTTSRTRSARDVVQTVARGIERSVAATSTRDGAGVRLTRMIGSRALPMLDPFLLLDEFHSRDPDDWRAGFPTHPHRGFQTVTIMFDGEVEHKDSVGHHGIIGAGAVQWMTAGRGILHSEFPRASTTNGDLWGYQLWVNLPSHSKMCAPRYQELDAAAFARVDVDEGQARIIAGAVGARRGPIEDPWVDPLVLDVALPAGARLRHAIPATHNAALVVIQGEVAVGGARTVVGASHVAVLGAGDVVDVSARRAARLLVLGAQPLREPIARRGPFVMNTDAELQQAFDDYRSGRLVDG